MELVAVDAYAKLTLSLAVIGVRADGYHLIDSEMVTIDLADTLWFGPGSGLRTIGPVTVDAGDDNLVVRALRAVGCTASVRLVKRIPVGAGLGGGSADAAAVLRWAGVSDLAVAAGLGADVPFCVRGGRARVTGVGEAVEPLAFSPDEPYTLLTPPVHVSTPAVYRAWDAMGGPTGAVNDLEAPALQVEPSLARYREELGSATGLTPVLAGSGSTWWVRGAFPDVPGAVVVRSVAPAHVTGSDSPG